METTKPMKTGRKIKYIWNENQIQWLRENYTNLGANKCEEFLKIERCSIFRMAKSLGLTTVKNGPWTQEEKEIIEKYYIDYSAFGIQEKLGLLKNRSRGSIGQQANKMGIYWEQDLSHFINIIDPFVAYILGFIYADGTVSKTNSHVEFKIVNEDFLEIKDRFLSTARWLYKLYDDGFENHKIQAVVAINNRPFRNFLVENDYLIKSGASADKILSKIPENLKHYWWRGYFDGDGCFMWGAKWDKNASIASCFKQDWTFAEKLAQKLDFTYRISRGISADGNKRSNFHMDNYMAITKFCGYIYQGEMFGLSRKYNRYLEYLKLKENAWPDKTSKFKGVSYQDGVFILQIYLHGKRYIEYFHNEIEAAQWYDRLAYARWGNKAQLNFPNEISKNIY